VPSLKDIGKNQENATTYFIGGENEAVKRMQEYLKNKKKVCSFEKPLTLPTSLTPDTTALSPYLKFGCLSPRLFYYEI
jgi:cryptochrome